MIENREDVEMFSGETKEIEVHVVDDAGNDVNLTGYSISWILSRYYGGTAVITKTVGSGITVTDAAHGLFKITVTATESAGYAGQYVHRALIDLSGVKAMVLAGTFVVLESVRTGYTTPTYCTVEEVMSMLRLINGTSYRLVPDETTDPLRSEVERYIMYAEDEIDARTGFAWRSKTVTNEYHDAVVSWDTFYRRMWEIQLRHRMVKAFDHASGDKIELFDGSSWVDLVAGGYTEAWNGDYFVDYEIGAVFIMGKRPVYGRKSIRITYRYGAATIPKDISECAAKMAAIKVLENDFYRAAVAAGPEIGSRVDRAIDRWRQDVERTIAVHQEIML